MMRFNIRIAPEEGAWVGCHRMSFWKRKCNRKSQISFAMGKTKKNLLDTEKVVVQEKSDKFYSSELQAFHARRTMTREVTPGPHQRIG